MARQAKSEELLALKAEHARLDDLHTITEHLYVTRWWTLGAIRRNLRSTLTTTSAPSVNLRLFKTILRVV